MKKLLTLFLAIITLYSCTDNEESELRNDAEQCTFFLLKKTSYSAVFEISSDIFAVAYDLKVYLGQSKEDVVELEKVKSESGFFNDKYFANELKPDTKYIIYGVLSDGKNTAESIPVEFTTDEFTIDQVAFYSSQDYKSNYYDTRRVFAIEGNRFVLPGRNFNDGITAKLIDIDDKEKIYPVSIEFESAEKLYFTIPEILNDAGGQYEYSRDFTIEFNGCPLLSLDGAYNSDFDKVATFTVYNYDPAITSVDIVGGKSQTNEVYFEGYFYTFLPWKSEFYFNRQIRQDDSNLYIKQNGHTRIPQKERFSFLAARPHNAVHESSGVHVDRGLFEEGEATVWIEFKMGEKYIKTNEFTFTYSE